MLRTAIALLFLSLWLVPAPILGSDGDSGAATFAMPKPAKIKEALSEGFNPLGRLSESPRVAVPARTVSELVLETRRQTAPAKGSSKIHKLKRVFRI